MRHIRRRLVTGPECKSGELLGWRQMEAKKNQAPFQVTWSFGIGLEGRQDYFLKPFTFLETGAEEAGLLSLAQAPSPNAAATMVNKAMCFIVFLVCRMSAGMANLHL